VWLNEIIQKFLLADEFWANQQQVIAQAKILVEKFNNINAHEYEHFFSKNDEVFI
jgi:hypothetical protein